MVSHDKFISWTLHEHRNKMNALGESNIGDLSCKQVAYEILIRKIK